MHLSELVHITPVSIQRDGDFFSLGKATHSLEQMLVFVESEKYLGPALSNPNISCIITTGELFDQIPPRIGVAISQTPRNTFFEIHSYLAAHTQFYWKDFQSEIDVSAEIHPSAQVASMNVMIGRGVKIDAGVVVCGKTLVGNCVQIGSNTVVGGMGFEYFRKDGIPTSVVHAGGVQIGDNVEIHANCTIDRSIFGDCTKIGKDTKIDNLVHIAHRVDIGQRCMLAAGAIVAGNVKIGDDCWVGPRSVLSNGITLGAKAYVTIGSVVANNVPAGRKVTGNFAIQHDIFMKNMYHSITKH